MTIDYYQAKDHAPLPPKNADVMTTACDYCIVACGYKVYHWPVGAKDGGMKAADNAFGVDFPSNMLQEWVAPTQHNICTYKGKKHNVVVILTKTLTLLIPMVTHPFVVVCWHKNVITPILKLRII